MFIVRGIPVAFIQPIIIAISLAVMICAGASHCHAAQQSLQFKVSVSLAGSGHANTGLCRSNSRINVFGEAVTVICSSGEAVDFTGDTSGLPWTGIQDGSFRYVTLNSEFADSLATLESFSGKGTVTSWRVVNLADREYLELMVGW